jgi:hypothetical protein
MSSRTNSAYIVRDTNGTGSRYLVRRVSPTATNRYRWAKRARYEAAILTYDAARKVVRNYGGEMVPAYVG